MREDDYDDLGRSPADPPMHQDDFEDLADGEWWRQLDVVRVVGIVLAVVAVVLFAIIAVQRLVG